MRARGRALPLKECCGDDGRAAAVHVTRAIELAADAREHGNHPFGSLLVDGDGNVVLEAENTVVTGRDCTAHAEQNLVRAAVSQFEPDRLATFTLYASTRALRDVRGSIFWSGIGAVRLRAERSATLARGVVRDPTGVDALVSSATCSSTAAAAVEVQGPLLEDHGPSVHEASVKPLAQA